jgi:hypothetical protein
MTALCALPGIGERSKPSVPIPADGELDTMAAAVPPMIGAEYVTTEVLVNLWRGMDLAFERQGYARSSAKRSAVAKPSSG